MQLVSFIGSDEGPWSVTRMTTVAGPALASVKSVRVVEGDRPGASSAWQLRGIVSNLRYTTRRELSSLASSQPRLGRQEATLAALIPIKKSSTWWDLAQDERRSIFEETSRHTTIGISYLPAIARKLHHSRDLGEPFDFLTWFEFSPSDEAAFDELLGRLRATAEWKFVEREIDIRLSI